MTRYDLNIILSEQEILACGNVNPYRLKGCAGGRPSEVLRYISDKGINVEKNYPYNDKQAVNVKLTCKRETGKPKFEHKLHIARPHWNIVSVMRFLVHGPVVVNHYVPQFFEYYSSGIFRPYNCPVLHSFNDRPKDMTLDHSSIVVGYNFVSEDKPYFIFKNSWGLRWGEKGRLTRLLPRRDRAAQQEQPGLLRHRRQRVQRDAHSFKRLVHQSRFARGTRRPRLKTKSRQDK